MSMFGASIHGQFQGAQSFIERDGFEIGYSIEGTGSPVMIVGPVGYDQKIFSQNLRQHAQLIFIDHRGFSPSHKPIDAQAITMDTLLEDIEYIRSQLKLEKFTIMGQSAHGLLVLEYAKKYPEYVDGVVIICTGKDLDSQGFKLAEQYFQDSVCPERKLIDEQLQSLLPAQIAAEPDKEFLLRLISLAARSWYDYNFDPAPLWEGTHVNMSVMQRVWGKLFVELDITQGLENFTTPVLLVLGKFDYLITPFFVWNEIRSKFKNLTVKLFERSGHTVPFEEPELFDTTLLDWINR